MGESKKSIVPPLESIDRYKYNHLAFHQDVGLVYPPIVASLVFPTWVGLPIEQCFKSSDLGGISHSCENI
jgi:hypothetical protein